MRRRRKPRTPEEVEAAIQRENERLAKHIAERRKFLVLEDQLYLIGQTDVFMMHCPVCGSEIAAQASVRRAPSHAGTQLVFGMHVYHDCPQSEMSREERYALMRQSGLTIKELAAQMFLSDDEKVALSQNPSLWD